jgi:hypothetical protein
MDNRMHSPNIKIINAYIKLYYEPSRRRLSRGWIRVWKAEKGALE